MVAAAVVGIGVIGTFIGSFLNVVIFRVPRGESVVRPRSHCGSCGAGVRPRDEVPIISWVLLRGRCRDCKSAISLRYPLVELATGVLFALFAATLGFSWQLPAYLYLAAVGLALAMIDVDIKRLPNSLTLPSYVVGVALLGLAALGGHSLHAFVRSLIAMMLLYVAYFLLAMFYRGGMGFGDVKLAGVLGLYLGWLGWGSVLVGTFAAFLFGGSVGVALLLMGGHSRKSRIAFGPFMLAGALVAIVAGQALANSYLQLAR